MKLLPKGSYFIEKFRKRLRLYVGIRVFDSQIGSLAACLAGLPQLLEAKLRYRKTSVLTYMCINVNTSIGGSTGVAIRRGSMPEKPYGECPGRPSEHRLCAGCDRQVEQ